MPDAVLKPNESTAPVLEGAFAALRSYQPGSPRGDLLPLDDAVRRSLSQEADRSALEKRLIAPLAEGVPVEAKEYACRQLTILGTDEAVPALAKLLVDPGLHEAARQGLEALPGEAATRALRRGLKELDGARLAGVVVSLGRRRDRESVAPVAAMLEEADAALAAAAWFALGRIGTPAAAVVLAEWAGSERRRAVPTLGDALLACAESLLEAGSRAEALPLCRRAAGPPFSAQVQAAARRLGGF